MSKIVREILADAFLTSVTVIGCGAAAFQRRAHPGSDPPLIPDGSVPFPLPKSTKPAGICRKHLQPAVIKPSAGVCEAAYVASDD